MASPGWGSPSSSWFCFSSLILRRDKEGIRGDRLADQGGGMGRRRRGPVLPSEGKGSTCVGSALGIALSSGLPGPASW